MAGFLAYVTIVEGGPVDPGFGRPGGGGSGNYPDQGLPGGGGYPDQGLPGGGGGRPGQGLPPFPSQGLPGQGGGRPDQGLPPFPDQGLPGGRGHPSHPIYHPDKPVPPGTSPGAGIWVVAYVPGKGAQWVAITPGVPEKPVPPEGGGEAPDQGLPPNPNPPTGGQPLPPTAGPKGTPTGQPPKK